MKYKTIYADPPWNERGGGKIKRGADRHYPLMSTLDICNLQVNGEHVSHLAEDNAHLYLWVTNNFLEDGLRVMDAWGFEYKTLITWVKDKFGLGQYYRGQTEHCLFGVRGSLPFREKELPKSSLFEAGRAQGVTVICANRGKHSTKPQEMRDMIEAVSYPPPY